MPINESVEIGGPHAKRNINIRLAEMPEPIVSFFNNTTARFFESDVPLLLGIPGEGVARI